MRVLAWGLRIALAALFLAAGSGKLAGGAEAAHAFATLGFGDGFRIFIGACEVLGAIGLLLPPVAGLAALGLALVMVGAVASHLLVLGPSAGPAVAALVGTLTVAWLERRRLAALQRAPRQASAGAPSASP